MFIHKGANRGISRLLRDDKQFEQLIVRLLCVAMRAYRYIKIANYPNLQNFENERTISMDIKKFLTWENAGKFAAAYVAADILLGGRRSVPSNFKTITSKNGGVTQTPETGGY